MRARLVLPLLILGLLSLPSAWPAQAASPATPPQTISIHDTRSGDSPCGFSVERTIEGAVELAPSLDADGNLVLTIAPVSLHGTLTNPANDKAVELNWVQPTGSVSFRDDGQHTIVTWLLNGYFFRGYDDARTDLSMTLPADGAERASFAPGVRSPDPWTHVCAMLA